jgi:hypothetical protein
VEGWEGIGWSLMVDLMEMPCVREYILEDARDGGMDDDTLYSVLREHEFNSDIDTKMNG